MIPKHLKRDDLIGRKCLALRDIRNGSGKGISARYICTIKGVVRGHGFIIQTEKCPHCGQYAYFTHVSREDLELISEDINQGSDLVYHSDNNSEALLDLNTAIKALYAIDAGALSANTLNTPVYVEDAIRHLQINVAEWAGKLEMMRSLLFGEGLHWEYIQQQLDRHDKDGGNGNG